MQGIALVIAFVIAIIIMVVAISKWKIHAFLSIMGVSVLFALVAGLKLTDIPGIIGAGFSGTFTSIGIVIILGALIGNILEKTGGALKLSDMVVNLVGKKKPELAVLLMGWIVSIPVFCDSGFVILNPIRKALAQRTKTSNAAMAVALSAGLYTSHVFIPPTPGPIAAANTLGAGDYLLLVIGIGCLISILPLIAGYLFSKYIGKKIPAEVKAAEGETVKSYEELVKDFGTLPGGFAALAPILVPIVLMALASIASMAKMTGTFSDILKFLGAPVIALAVGTIFGISLLFSQNKGNTFFKLTDDTLRVVGPILFVTAAGGVLGRVVSSSSLVEFIKTNAVSFSTIGIFFPFILSAILKTAQGSSTVALTTTAGILQPLLAVLGITTPALTAVTVMAIAAGAMTVSHANDSYFWVVTEFGGIETKDGYKTQTLMTLVIGLASMIGIVALYYVLK
ncbi:MAG: GntP family permease [Fusobacteriaceae bacterium]|jgi:GntP family gluconate:H+ symporter|nr:GntP family permease [Fusobacteriaceae bacterium]